MTKERIILAFVAIVAGLIVASSLFYFYRQKETPKLGETQPTPEVSLPNGKVSIEIETPQEGAVAGDKNIEIKGRTLPNSIVVLTTSTDDFVITSDENGTFTKTITLVDDENIITATAYSDSGTSETKEIIVTYNTEEF